MPDFVTLGKQLIQFDIGISGLENRVNRLTREGKIKDADAKELVTGFIDAAIGAKESPGEIYGMVHGFARWLYNGDYTTVLQSIYRNMAETGKGIDVLKSADDKQGIQAVAELAWEKHPTITIDLYTGANRNELLRKIAEHNFNAKEIGITKSCLTELKDIPGLRRHALARIEDHYDYAEGILKEHGTDDDFRAVVKFLRKRNKNGTFPYCQRESDHVTAYDWAMRIKEPTPADTEIIGKLKTVLIEKSPEEAIRRFWKEGPRRYNGCSEAPVCTDKEGVIAAGKKLLTTSNIFEAINAFKSVHYDGPEFLEAGVQVIKKYYEPNQTQQLYDDNRQDIQAIAQKAIPAYLAAGGSILAVASLINSERCGDDMNRRIGDAQLSNTDKTLAADTCAAINAYERFIAIRNPTLEDNAKLAEMRKKMIEGDRGTYLFEHCDDMEGMRMYLDALRGEQPCQAYQLALKRKDTQLVGELRQEILSKKSPKHALDFFTENGDKTGIQMVRDKIGQGIDPSIIDTLVERAR
jgi:hypothetical protein